MTPNSNKVWSSFIPQDCSRSSTHANINSPAAPAPCAGWDSHENGHVTLCAKGDLDAPGCDSVTCDRRLTPACDSAIVRAVKSVFAILVCIIALLLPAAAGEKVVMFARLKDTTDVALSTGAKWRMDKGDAFPVIAYKESHTVIILQLAGAQFMVSADKTEIVPDKELPAAIAKYRENVVNYINGFSDRWKRNAQEGKPAQ